MTRDEAFECLRKGFDGVLKWNDFRLTNRDEDVPSLQGIDLIGTDLQGANFTCCDLQDAKLTGADLRRAKFRNSDLEQATLTQAVIFRTDFIGANMCGAAIDAIRRSPPGETEGGRASITVEVDVWEGGRFDGADLTNANLANSQLVDGSFVGTTLKGTVLKNADLTGANMTGAIVDGKTDVTGVKWDGVLINRFTLECFTPEQIPLATRLHMDIRDDVATLRSAYSGFWRGLNAIFLLTFVAPYVAEVVKLWGRSRLDFMASENTVELWRALACFILSGGEHYGPDWPFPTLSFYAFVLAFVYNVLRGALLFKTIKLETEQEVRGLPVKFSLDGSRWGLVYRASNWLLWANMLGVIYHTFHFLTQRVPV